MKPPSIVLDPQRLATLQSYGILDTPEEAGFDDIVQLASFICETPVSLVSFVAEDRQWFKARTGFAQPQTDLSRSVCAHALVQPDLLIIPDLTQDDRTRENPLVTGDPNIRFYAGAPLIASTGEAMGSLCVIDAKPRPQGLTETQQSMLKALARQVMAQMELRRTIAEREAVMAEKLSAEAIERATSQLYNTLFTAIDAGFCIVEMQFDGSSAVDYRFIEHNPAFEQQTGLAGARGRMLSDLVPGVEQHWLDFYGKVATTGESGRIESPAAGLGGRWYEVNAFPIEHASGTRVGILFNDISSRKENERARGELESVQALMNQELAHRLKNTLAMVQAIANQTLRGVSEQELVRSFSSRIMSLSKAHEVLLHQNWEAAPIADVVAAVLGTLVPATRFNVAGPVIRLNSRATLSLSLLLHELATNAMKYGALSTEAGSIAVSWSLTTLDGNPAVGLHWVESGGPAATPPQRKGFGTRLIGMGLVGNGGADLRYGADGFAADFTALLDEIQIVDPTILSALPPA